MSGFNPGTLDVWAAAGAIQIVPMGQVQFLDFRQRDAIGTGQLGSCSVVVIASAQGAILAHIPPQPQPTNNLTSGDANVRSMMDRVGTLYQGNPQFFPSTDTVVVCAYFRGQVLCQASSILCKRVSLHWGLPRSLFRTRYLETLRFGERGRWLLSKSASIRSQRSLWRTVM